MWLTLEREDLAEAVYEWLQESSPAAVKEVAHHFDMPEKRCRSLLQVMRRAGLVECTETPVPRRSRPLVVWSALERPAPKASFTIPDVLARQPAFFLAWHPR